LALKIEVRMTNEGERTYGAMFMREVVGKIVSAIILNIGFIIAAFDDRKQALHDKMANTVVVHKDPNNKAPKWLVGLILGIYFGFVFFIFAICAIIGIAVLSEEMNDSVNESDSYYDSQFEDYYDQNYDDDWDYDYDYDYDTY